jgi:2-methylisocitrate lyase-like PEP mutase family enzyme
MTVTQLQKAERFRQLHERPGAFVIPNPWDAGTARILTSLGFEALTTTSAGLAFSLGRRDQAGLNTRREVLENAKTIVDATVLPVAADLESGYGDDPEDVGTTIRLAAEEAGLVGGSIEDSRADTIRPVYDFEQAVERVGAAVEAARALPFPFMLVARAENYLYGRRDLDDTIRRLQAFERAGADVLYAPGITTPEEIRAVCSSVTRPVNVLMTSGSALLTVAELASLGVKRISVGAALCRVALGAMMSAAREMKEQGTFDAVRRAIPFSQLNELMIGR